MLDSLLLAAQASAPSATSESGPMNSALAFEAVKILLAVVVTYVFTKWQSGRKAESTLATQGDSERVIGPIKEAIDEMRQEFDGEFEKVRAAQRSTDAKYHDKLQKLEFVVLGIDGMGGLAATSAMATRRQAADHEMLLHLLSMTRELYRVVTKQEPPPVPPTITESIT